MTKLPFGRLSMGWLFAMLFLLSACAIEPEHFPFATMVDGKPAYGIRGVYDFSGDKEKARKKIIANLMKACEGPIEIKYMKIAVIKDPLAPMVGYSAVAVCVPEKTGVVYKPQGGGLK